MTNCGTDYVHPISQYGRNVWTNLILMPLFCCFFGPPPQCHQLWHHRWAHAAAILISLKEGDQTHLNPPGDLLHHVDGAEQPRQTHVGFVFVSDSTFLDFLDDVGLTSTYSREVCIEFHYFRLPCDHQGLACIPTKVRLDGLE